MWVETAICGSVTAAFSGNRPPDGGTLEWRVLVRHERGNDVFDALLNAEWGIFRAEDVIPRARTRTLKGAASRTTLAFDLPAGWSAISEYSASRATYRRKSSRAAL